ncbi:hypothetical protein E2C01_043805 [Portunus trituberculatus]|uniref:Uncharacterized protein n=1 Tax=Portunus trituberculatus TaxID=210409 RepID=A0A5B7FX35_PORTR|nr:hypothetical protein [Portunus trituberculatus]
MLSTRGNNCTLEKLCSLAFNLLTRIAHVKINNSAVRICFSSPYNAETNPYSSLTHPFLPQPNLTSALATPCLSSVSMQPYHAPPRRLVLGNLDVRAGDPSQRLL